MKHILFSISRFVVDYMYMNFADRCLVQHMIVNTHRCVIINAANIGVYLHASCITKLATCYVSPVVMCQCAPFVLSVQAAVHP